MEQLTRPSEWMDGSIPTDDNYQDYGLVKGVDFWTDYGYKITRRTDKTSQNITNSYKLIRSSSMTWEKNLAKKVGPIEVGQVWRRANDKMEKYEIVGKDSHPDFGDERFVVKYSYWDSRKGLVEKTLLWTEYNMQMEVYESDGNLYLDKKSSRRNKMIKSAWTTDNVIRDEGWDAFNKGLSRSENPYKFWKGQGEEQQYDDWNEGWEAAYYESTYLKSSRRNKMIKSSNLQFDSHMNKNDVYDFIRRWNYAIGEEKLNEIASVEYDPNSYETVDGAYIITYKDGSIETAGWADDIRGFRWLNTKHNHGPIQSSRRNNMIKSSWKQFIKGLDKLEKRDELKDMYNQAHWEYLDYIMPCDPEWTEDMNNSDFNPLDEIYFLFKSPSDIEEFLFECAKENFPGAKEKLRRIRQINQTSITSSTSKTIDDIVKNYESWSGFDMEPACKNCAKALKNAGFNKSDVQDFFYKDGIYNEETGEGTWDKDYVECVLKNINSSVYDFTGERSTILPEENAIAWNEDHSRGIWKYGDTWKLGLFRNGNHIEQEATTDETVKDRWVEKYNMIESSRITSATEYGWEVTSSDAPKALEMWIEEVGKDNALEDIAYGMSDDSLRDDLEYIARNFNFAENIEDLSTWDMFEISKEYLGVDTLLDNLTQAMGYNELADQLVTIFRQHDFRRWDEIESSRKSIKSSPQMPVDEHEVNEIALTVVNDGDIQPKVKSVIDNLKRKIKNGSYNKELSYKLWQYVADEEARKIKAKWGGEYSPATRYEAAKQLAEHYDEDLYEN